MSKINLCVALDLPTLQENLTLATKLKEFDIWLKVGLRSYIRDGKRIIDELKIINPNFKIFLDLKLYDIPNTMADTAEVIANLNVDMFNIHASSGFKAMDTVMKRISGVKNKPLVLAVTALTSFSNEDFQKVYNQNIEKQASFFAKESFKASLDVVVCSVYESKIIKNATNEDFLTLTPGIRPFGESSNDQQRVATVQTAKEELVNFIVVGRPIYQSLKPQDVVKKIIEQF
jgi:orotidine-5'-phosphate decarboxylase